MASFYRALVFFIFLIAIPFGIFPIFLPDENAETQCGWNVECEDGISCTANRCENGKCVTTTLTCDTGDPCIIGTCDESAGGCVFFQKSTTCTPHEPEPCATFKCSPDTGECARAERNCTLEQLSIQTAVEIHVLCNQWSCDPETGLCLATPLDGQPCGNDQFCVKHVCQGGVCVDGPFCSNGNDSCTTVSCVPDFSPARIDQCVIEINSSFCPEIACQDRSCVTDNCVYAEIPGCCTRDRDCLANLSTGTTTTFSDCTLFVCINSTCIERSATDCCTADIDCDDFDPCSQDFCNFTTQECFYEPIDPCCVTATDCNTTETCRNWTCVNRTCVFDLLPENSTCNVEEWRTCDEALGKCDLNGTCVTTDPDGNCPQPGGCAVFACNLTIRTCEQIGNASLCANATDCIDADCLEDGNCSYTNKLDGTECPPAGCALTRCSDGVCISNSTFDCFTANPCEVWYCNATTGNCTLNFTIPCDPPDNCTVADCAGGECFFTNICTTSTVTACANDTQIACFVQLVNSSDVCFWAPDPTCPNMTDAAAIGAENASFALENCTDCCPPPTSSTSSSSLSSSSVNATSSTTSSICDAECCPDFHCQCWDCVPSNFTGACTMIAEIDETFTGLRDSVIMGVGNWTLQRFCVEKCIQTGNLDVIWRELLFS